MVIHDNRSGKAMSVQFRSECILHEYCCIQGLSLCYHGCMAQEALSVDVWGLMMSVYWYSDGTNQWTVYIFYKVHIAYTAYRACWLNEFRPHCYAKFVSISLFPLSWQRDQHRMTYSNHSSGRNHRWMSCSEQVAVELNAITKWPLGQWCTYQLLNDPCVHTLSSTLQIRWDGTEMANAMAQNKTY